MPYTATRSASALRSPKDSPALTTSPPCTHAGLCLPTALATCHLSVRPVHRDQHTGS